MEKYIQFVLNWPKSILIFIIASTLFLSMGIPKIVLDNSMEVMMPEADVDYIYYKNSQKIYGNTGKFIIMDVYKEGKIWTSEFFIEIDKLISDIEEYMTCDEQLEQSRLKTFKTIMQSESIQYTDILKKFQGDENFQRVLSRKVLKNFKQVDQLTQEQLKILEKEILTTYETKKTERIERIISPLTIQDASGENDELVTYDVIEKDANGKRILPSTDADFDRLKKILLKTPSFEKYLYAKHPKTNEITDLCILVTLDTESNHDDIAREMWDITNSYQAINIIIQGVPIVNKEMNDFMHKDMQTFALPIALVMIIIFFLNFKSTRGVILPFIILIISTTWIMGLMGHLGFRFTAMSAGLPVFLMAVGSSYSIHILNQYYTDFKLITKKGKKEGLRLSMSHISITIMLAGVTTFIGFLTLTTNQITAIREWAIFSALGVILSVFLTVSIIPATFMLLAHKMPRIMLKKDNTIRKSPVDYILPVMTRLSINYHRPFLVVVSILLIISIIGIFKMNVETDMLSYFKEGSYVRTSIATIGEKFGGSSGFSILVDTGKTDGVVDHKFLKRVDAFRTWLLTDPTLENNIGSTAAFSDIIKKMNMAMNEDDPSKYAIPDSSEEVWEYLELFSGDDENSDGRIDAFESFIDPDFQTIHILLRVCSKDGSILGTGKMERIVNIIQKRLDVSFPEYKTKITGEVPTFIKLSKYVVGGQVKTLMFCLVVVCIIIILLFKNIFSGIVALIPMGVAVIINFGIMGWFSINLDMSTALIASVTIGIGVDDTIHFLNSFRYFRDKGYSLDDTIAKTLNISGRAIIYTSLALVFGFSVLMLSSFQPLQYFGLLLAISMIATTFGALAVLPSVIKATNISLDESTSNSFVWKYLYIGRLFGIEKQKESK